MSWKNTLLFGAITGMLVAIFILVIFVLAGIDPGSFAGLCGGFFLLATLSATIVVQISKRTNLPDAKLKTLIPVGFLTSIIPLVGATFGLPNSNLASLVMLLALGAAGGIFWRLPIVGWDYFKSRN